MFPTGTKSYADIPVPAFLALSLFIYQKNLHDNLFVFNFDHMVKLFV